MNCFPPIMIGVLYLFSSSDTKVTSSICASFIVLATFVNVQFGLNCFLTYLFLDVLSKGKPNDIIAHHIISIILTSLGYILLLQLKDAFQYTTVENAIIRLLMMEITTPFLNLAKYLHAQKNKLTHPVFAALLVLWIIFRILGPLVTLMELYKLLYFDLGIIFKVIYGSIMLLFVMQCVWFVKLVRMAF